MNYDLFSASAGGDAPPKEGTKLVSEDTLNASIRKVAEAMGLNGPEQVENTTIASAFPISDCTLLKGDNLKALSLLLHDKAANVDFCYIDPPYNTGQNFVYRDSRNSESGTVWGRHHDWMTFMLPRLIAARMLLKDTGIIAVSIDDYEYAHLKILMDHIFKPDNYIATLIVCRSKNGKGSKKHVAVNHEYVILYGKTDAADVSGIAESDSRMYEKEDQHGKYRIDGLFRKKGDASLREDRPNMHYPLYYSKTGEVFVEKNQSDLAEVFPKDSKGIARRWLWGKDKARAESWKLFASPKGTVYVKNYHTENKRVKLRSILDRDDYLTDKATTELKNIYGEKVFETPKPLALIMDLVDTCCPSDGIVLDFFAGTGTTAEAVWTLNLRDACQRRTILVEQNARIDERHLAARRGFSVTSDITAFRLTHMQERDESFRFVCQSIQD